jgi:hypothetical protein
VSNAGCVAEFSQLARNKRADAYGLWDLRASVWDSVLRAKEKGASFTWNASTNLRARVHGNTDQPASGGGRTHNLWLRRPTLYPVELRTRSVPMIIPDPAGVKLVPRPRSIDSSLVLSHMAQTLLKARFGWRIRL